MLHSIVCNANNDWFYYLLCNEYYFIRSYLFKRFPLNERSFRLVSSGVALCKIKLTNSMSTDASLLFLGFHMNIFIYFYFSSF